MKIRLVALAGLVLLSILAVSTPPPAFAVPPCSPVYCAAHPIGACSCPTNSGCPGCITSCNHQSVCNQA